MMPISRIRMPAWRRLMFETLHVALDDYETACGLTMQPILRVMPAFDEAFWTGDFEAPIAGACRRCAAGMRLFAREFRRDTAKRHPRTREHWDNCWCGQYIDLV
jgi:hypothetical protein